MGSTGSGRFGDYPAGGTGGGQQGGKDPCAEEVVFELEEVATCPYFQAQRAVPPVGAAVGLRQALVGGRLAVESQAGEVIGYAPTQFNYLRGCMQQGFAYSGEVQASGVVSGVPTVRVRLSS
jgi:hypothetical protein